MRKSQIRALAMLLCVTGLAHARDDTDPYDKYRDPNAPGREFAFDESLIEPWKEQKVKIPPLSETGLQPIEIDQGPPGMRFLVDTSTISINEKDRLVRYWVVMESGGQRTNILYEGLRCSDLMYKTYAYASPRDPSKMKYPKSAEWSPVEQLGGAGFRRELAENYFCSWNSPRSEIGINTAVGGYEDTSNPNLEDADFLPK